MLHLKEVIFKEARVLDSIFLGILHSNPDKLKNLKGRMILLKGLCAEPLSTPSSVRFLWHIGAQRMPAALALKCRFLGHDPR